MHSEILLHKVSAHILLHAGEQLSQGLIFAETLLKCHYRVCDEAYRAVGYLAVEEDVKTPFLKELPFLQLPVAEENLYIWAL